jgi:uncharacterized protein
MQKNCSKCARGFHCGAMSETATGAPGFSCWCAELPHVPLVADANQDCLCPECLIEAIEKLADRQEQTAGADGR